MKNNSMKRIGSLMLCLLLVCSLFGAPRAKADNAVQDARKSVVQIFTYVDVGANNRIAYAMGSGTGFFVGEKGKDVQYVVTNRHVVDVSAFAQEIRETNTRFRNAELNSYQMWVLIDGEAYDIDYVNNVYLSQIADLAIVKLSEPVKSRVPATLGDPDKIDVTDTVYAIGFPDYSMVEDKSNNVYTENLKDIVIKEYPSAIDNMSVTKGSVVKNHVTSGGIDYVQHDAAISHGNSGGPLLDEKGAVVGVNTYGVTSELATANYAIDVNNVKTFLKQNNVPFIEASVQTSAPAAPVVTAAPATAKPTATPEPEPEKKDIPWTTIAAAGGGVLALAILAFAISKSRKKKAPEPVVPQTPVPDPGKTTPVVKQPVGKKLVPIVRSLAQQHGNRKIAIDKEAIILGRSSDCKIVYREGTPGVSARHCAITWDPEHSEFVLKDMGSTYGTFLDSGMKLDPNKLYRLKPGESFYLGEKSNMVKLEVE